MNAATPAAAEPSPPAAVRGHALDAETFARHIDRLGPFEPQTELAVAVSGGRDSMALTLLADDWARRRGGGVVALTVDHGLRPESAAEARQVGRWLKARGIAHRILVWRGDKPASGLQAAARAARYRLLTDWCRRHGVLHLALAHQRDDQAETHLMRRRRGDGLDGLSAMAAVRSQDGVRLLRPLLAVPRARLTATLSILGQAWIDDPSNADPGFERTRLGADLAAIADTGGEAELLARTAAAGHGRAALEREVAALAARAVGLSPAGFALLQPAPLAAAPARTRRGLWARLLRCIGGGDFVPATAALERLDAAFLAEGGALRRTLGGCRLNPWQDRLLVVRENRHAPPAQALGPGMAVQWGRFRCRLGRRGTAGAWVDALGPEGWRQVRSRQPELGRSLPLQVLPVLPALWDRHGPLAVPHLAYLRAGASASGFRAEFRPARTLAETPFTVAEAVGETI